MAKTIAFVTFSLISLIRIVYLAICKSPIVHLVCPRKFCVSIPFYFSWDHCNTQEESKTKVMQSFGGKTRCLMGDVQMAKGVIRGRSRPVTLPWEQIFGLANMADKNERHGHA